MSDLIDRQAAIDAVEESRRLNHHQDGKEACAHEYEHRHFLKILMELPSAQPEIIRCKDCRHNHDCSIQYHAQAGEEFYCGAAERRTDEA